MVGLIRFIVFFFVFLSYGQEHILIGDSQTYYLSKYTKQIKLIKKLSKSGIGVVGLNNKVVSYPTSKNIKSVSVCIGVNDCYQDKGVETLMNSIKRTFPNATIYIIQGSWGWGKVKKWNSNKILTYYKGYQKLGGMIIEPPIGYGDPHKDKPIYKKIINAIEHLINKIYE
jgi:hypothetical protein